ncbi:LSR protein, partial [Tricholaema leucomelas]|nr:LSR protein [Tricholaema leucomelas]
LQVWVSNPHTVALLFQPVLLRCHYRTAASSSSSSSSPIVTWKYKSFCANPSAGSDDPLQAGTEVSSSSSSSSSSCPDSSRTVRIVATKQGDLVTLGEFYRGRSVTVLGGAELSLGPAAWGDSGIYICTVTTVQDLVGNNEAVAELVVLGEA